MHPIRPDGKPHHPEDGWDRDGFPLSVAWTPNTHQTQWEGVRAIPWARFCVDHRRIDRKEDAPLWSPVILSTMERRASSVTHSTALVYDIDDGTEWYDIVDVLEIWGIRWWVYTTHSHTEAKHKFRVVLGLDEAIPASMHRQAWLTVKDFMGWRVDESCKDICRLYYFPSAREGAPAWQAWGDGPGCDWRAIVDATEASKATDPVERVVRTAERMQRETGERNIECTRKVLRDMLASMDPDGAYHQWVSMGMIAKECGMESEWIAWCQRGSKYRPGEPERKLRSFKR